MGIALGAALGVLDYVEIRDEFALAKLLRVVAEDADPGVQLLLRSLADALDHPDAEISLKLLRSKGGRPAEEAKQFNLKFNIAFYVWQRQLLGDPTEAAVADAKEFWNCSRASIFRAISAFKGYESAFASIRQSAESRESEA